MTEVRDAGRFRPWVAPIIVALILAGTLTPNFGSGEPISGLCLICGSRGTADAIANVLLFFPLGIALTWRLAQAGAAVLAALLLSGAIEGLQFLIPGRYPTLGDLVFNTLGAALGVLAVSLGRTLLHPGPTARRRLAVPAALVPAALLLATGWLLQPSFPRSVYYGQWMADLGHLEAYGGRILAASIGDLQAPSRRLDDSEAVRARLLEGAPVRVVFQPGPRPPGLAPIFSVFDAHQREIVLYGLDDRDLVFRYRSRAVGARLDQPDLRVRGGALDLPAPARPVTDRPVGRSGARPDLVFDVRADQDPEKVTMTVRLRDEGFCVRTNGRERACPVAHSMGRGWAFLLYPESFARRMLSGLDFLWVLLLTLPIGYWGRRPRRTLVLAAPAVAAAMLGPWIFGQVSFSVWVTVAALTGPPLGALLGSALSGRIARRRTRSRSATRRSGSL